MSAAANECIPPAIEGNHMDEIEAQFNAEFAHWSIRIPPEDIAQRRRGRILHAGWAIWYLFGSDEMGEYLDYYASHRMTDDRHVRIGACGRCEALPTIHGFRRSSEDPTEDARLAAEYYAENQRVAKLLEAKGFGMRGDEPGGVQINRFLHLEQPEDSDEEA
jgi:hypothetical protein